MKNPRFFYPGDIPLLCDEDRDNDYDDYNTSNRSIRQDTMFTDPDTKETTPTLRLRQKVKRDMLAALCRYLNITCDPYLANINRFMLKKNEKQLTLFFLLLLSFFDGKHWQSLISKCTGQFLTPNTLRDRFE